MENENVNQEKAGIPDAAEEAEAERAEKAREETRAYDTDEGPAEEQIDVDPDEDDPEPDEGDVPALHPFAGIDLAGIIAGFRDAWEEPEDDREEWETLCYPVQTDGTVLIIFRQRTVVREDSGVAHTVDRHRVLHVALPRSENDAMETLGKYRFSRTDREVLTAFFREQCLTVVERSVYGGDCYAVRVWPEENEEPLLLFRDVNRVAVDKEGTIYAGYSRNQLTKSRKPVVSFRPDGSGGSVTSEHVLRCADLTLDADGDLWYHLFPTDNVTLLHDGVLTHFPVELSGFQAFCLTSDFSKLTAIYADSPVETVYYVMDFQSGAFINARPLRLTFANGQTPDPRKCRVLGSVSTAGNLMAVNYDDTLYFFNTDDLCAGNGKEKEETYRFAFVTFPDGGKEYCYLLNDPAITEGDKVVVPIGKGDGTGVGTVARIERHSAESAPYPLDRIKCVIGKAKTEADD